MGFLRLHVRFSLLVAFATNLLRYGVVAIIAVSIFVALQRWRGVSPSEARADIPEAAVVALGLAVAMALYKTWRRARRRHYYNRTRYY